MKVNWDRKKLKEICVGIDYGYTTSAVALAEGPKFLRITDIVPDLIDWERVPYAKVDAITKEKYLLHDGDIVIARTGATTGYAKFLRNPPEAIFASYLVRLRINNQNDKQFIGIIVESNAYKNFIQNNLTGSAQPQASAQILASYEVSLPDLDTQQKLASVISRYGALIEINEKRIKILEERAKLLYTEWFVKFRFPGSENVKMIDSGTEYGMIPEGWTVRSLGEVGQINSENITKGKEPSIIQYIDIASVSTGKVDSMQEVPFVDAPGRARRMLRHGDIIWSTVRPNRKSYALIIEPANNLIASTGFAVIRATDVPYSCLYQLVTSDSFVSYLVSCAKGSAYPAVTSDDFTDAIVMIPETRLLKKFDLLCEPIMLEINKLHRQNTNLADTRDLLIPQLIAGKRELCNH